MHGSRMSCATCGVALVPADDEIFVRPAMPTKLYSVNDGAFPPKISGAICLPTVKLLPGAAWSSPPGSKSTPSNTHRIGQSTFQTSLALIGPCNANESVYPH